MNRSRAGSEGQAASPPTPVDETPKAPARRPRGRRAATADAEAVVAETALPAAPEPVVESAADPAASEEAPSAPRRGRRGLGPRSRQPGSDETPAAEVVAEPIEQAPEPAAIVETDSEPPAGDAQVEEASTPRRRSRGSRGGAGRRRPGDRPAEREPDAERPAPPPVRRGGPAIRPEMPPRDMIPPRGEATRRPRTESDRPPRRENSPPPVSREGGRSGTVESLIARQNVLFEEFAQQQGETLRQLQRSVRGVGGAQGSAGNMLALPKVAIFLDVPNLIYAAEQIGVRIDFGKLLDYLTEGRQLVRATAYAPVTDDPQTRFEAQRFVAPVINHGYKIVTKPWKRFADGSMKANFDIELAVDILTMSDRLDIVVLLSGDGDFRRVCELVESKGVRVEVVAFAQSSAKELREVADLYTDLNNILHIVGG